ncbi:MULTISPECIES: magnesium/cobalt transporter CorA [Mangrovimonas]|uniref:magnesium/cobalt transporter CorA n=1 Tax=Mangrovimonas TaxID=1211036 RepID=UPI0006B6486B|nr:MULTISPECIES: magnesium/cobalt transporter CorA [Mangrovimonas]OMP29913.1 magnesium and cobalt transport protein CorA [Mangrovimonas sp. DI 80]
MGKKRTSKYKKHIAKAPGTLIYTGEKNSQQLFIESFDYNLEGVTEKELKNIEDVFGYKTTESITWVNINGLNHIEAIEKAGDHYGLHPLILEDIVNTSQRPKIDEYDEYIFISLKMLHLDADENVIIEQVSFVMGDRYVLTFQEAEGDVFDNVRERIRSGKGRIRGMGADYLLYALVDAVVDHYYVVSEMLGNKIEDIEDSLFEGSMKDSMSVQILMLKKELLKVRRAIFPLREIISRIEKSESPLIDKKSIQFYRDIYDHVIQLSDNIDIFREMIWSLMDMYMTTISNRMNEVMKVLTIIATIFIPLTFIAGIYGMNFDHMPELHLKYGYYTVWIVMIAVFIAMVIYFKRKKWL